MEKENIFLYISDGLRKHTKYFLYTNYKVFMPRTSFFLGIGQQYRFGVFLFFFVFNTQIEYSAYITTIFLLFPFTYFIGYPYIVVHEPIYIHHIWWIEQCFCIKKYICRSCPNIYNCAESCVRNYIFSYIYVSV